MEIRPFLPDPAGLGCEHLEIGQGALARGVLRLIEDLVSGRCDSPVTMVLPMHVGEGATTRRVG